MTLPNERTRAVQYARQFLIKLISRPSNGGFERVPLEVKEYASRVLRHFPGSYDLEQAAKKAPDTFAKPDPRDEE